MWSDTMQSLGDTAGKLTETATNVYKNVKGGGNKTMEVQKPTQQYPNAGTAAESSWQKWALIGGGVLLLIVAGFLLLRRGK